MLHPPQMRFSLCGLRKMVFIVFFPGGFNKTLHHCARFHLSIQILIRILLSLFLTAVRLPFVHWNIWTFKSCALGIRVHLSESSQRKIYLRLNITNFFMEKYVTLLHFIALCIESATSVNFLACHVTHIQEP